jgi:hypothetical protein
MPLKLNDRLEVWLTPEMKSAIQRYAERNKIHVAAHALLRMAADGAAATLGITVADPHKPKGGYRATAEEIKRRRQLAERDQQEETQPDPPHTPSRLE